MEGLELSFFVLIAGYMIHFGWNTYKGIVKKLVIK